MATRSLNIAANTWTNIQALVAIVGKNCVVSADKAFEIAHSVSAPAGAGTAVAKDEGINVIQTTLHTTGNVWVRATVAAKVTLHNAGASKTLFSNA